MISFVEFARSPVSESRPGAPDLYKAKRSATWHASLRDRRLGLVAVQRFSCERAPTRVRTGKPRRLGESSMRKRRIAIMTALAVPFALGNYGGCSVAHAQPAPVTPAALQENAPSPYREARERGVHDGERAAYDDVHRGLTPDPNRHENYRHPPLQDHHYDEAYRDGFRQGYQSSFHR